MIGCDTKLTLVNISHYSDVIKGSIGSQITSLTIVYSTVYSGADQRKHQSFASLAFVRVIHRWPVNCPHKWPVTRKMFPFDDIIIIAVYLITWDEVSYHWCPNVLNLGRNHSTTNVALIAIVFRSHWLTNPINVAQWCFHFVLWHSVSIYAVNLAIINSSDGLSPVWHQAIA